MLILELGEVINILVDDYVEVILRLVSGNIIFGEGLRHGGGVSEEMRGDVARQCGRNVDD